MRWGQLKVNTYQQLLNVGLAVESTSDQPLFYRPTWSADGINTYIETLFPEVFAWLKRTYPLADPSEYYWHLLLKDRLRLEKFAKRDPITGEDLSKVKGPPGRGWTHYKLIFGAYLYNFDATQGG